MPRHTDRSDQNWQGTPTAAGDSRQSTFIIYTQVLYGTKDTREKGLRKAAGAESSVQNWRTQTGLFGFGLHVGYSNTNRYLLGLEINAVPSFIFQSLVA